MLQEKISINHKNEVEQRFKILKSSISEYSFANLYLFRKKHHYELVRDYDLFIKGISSDGHTYLMPTSEAVFTNQQRLRELLNNCDYLFPIPEQWLNRFDASVFSYQYRPSESDYLFKREKLDRYAGRRLSGKRNLMKQFLEHYRVRHEPLDQSNKEQALSILHSWKEDKEQVADFEACEEALQKLKELELFGKIVYADEKPVGFTIGEKLHEKMAVIHFSKGLVEFKGIYQYLFHLFAASFGNQQLCINMEQDLGIESLKKSKHSYQPDKMLKKWRVTFKKRSFTSD